MKRKPVFTAFLVKTTGYLYSPRSCLLLFDLCSMRLITAPLTGSLLAASVYAVKGLYPQWFQAIAFMEDGLLFLAGLIAGLRLPDIDLLLPGFSHRSGLTHSCGFAALFMALGFNAIAGGLAIGIALHLSSDMQPKSWVGGALVKLPWFGSIGMLSPLWLLLNIAGCFWVLFSILPALEGMGRWTVLAVSVLGGIWYFFYEEKKRLLPLISLGFCLLLVHQYRDGRLSVELVIKYFV